MPRPLSGSILKRRLADDTLVVDVKIRGERRTLGPVSAWSEKRARNLLDGRLLPAARLRQDWAALIPGQPDGAGVGTLAGSLTVREAATEYVEALSRLRPPRPSSRTAARWSSIYCRSLPTWTRSVRKTACSRMSTRR